MKLTGNLSSSRELVKRGQYLLATRIFTKSCIENFCKNTLDYNDIHLSQTPAVVPGLLVASLFPAMFASKLNESMYRAQTLDFLLPVHDSRQVVAMIEVKTVRPYGDKTFIFCDTQAYLATDERRSKDIVSQLQGMESIGGAKDLMAVNSFLLAVTGKAKICLPTIGHA